MPADKWHPIKIEELTKPRMLRYASVEAGLYVLDNVRKLVYLNGFPFQFVKPFLSRSFL
jgi:hypothetical protein